MKFKYIALLIFMGLLALSYYLEWNICLVKNTIGLPCPSCGLTRAGMAVARLDFKEAINHHVLIYLLILMGPIFFLKEGHYHGLYKNKYFLLAVVGIFLVYYLVRMFMYFPDTPPMDFNDKALLPKLLRILKGDS